MLKVKAWMDVIRLKLNESKTKFIYFGSRNQLKKCTFDKTNIYDENFKEVTQLNIYQDTYTNISTSRNMLPPTAKQL